MTAHCPLCGSGDNVSLDRRERVPILLNRTYATAAAARAAPVGTIAYCGCNNCGFVWNAAFDARMIVYDGAYENDQSHSQTFRTHIEAMAERVIAMVPRVEPVDVVEVGAGQGVFLKAVSDRAGSRLGSIVGFDPAWRGEPGAGPLPVKLYTELFDKRASARLALAPNVIVSRHTIEHVERPLDFLNAIRDAVAPRDVRIAIETPCVRWIFDNWAIQDFFYEHCSLFTAETLDAALRNSGFSSTSIEHVFGGQYLWAEAQVGSSKRVAWPSARKLDFASWSRTKGQVFDRWRNYVASAAERGPVYVWGAGAKGVTFACLFDPDGTVLSGLVDINPGKQGNFAAMTGCPVIAPRAISGRHPAIIVMNPNYVNEIRRTCEELDIEPVIAIFEPKGSMS